MFLKRCRILKLEPLTEFFKHAGNLYDPLATLETQHNDETTESDSDTDGEDNIELL